MAEMPFNRPKSITEFTSWDATHSSLVDTDLLIMSILPTRTSFGDAFIASCVLLDNHDFESATRMQVLMGAQVLMNTLERSQDELPLLARITKMVSQGGREYATFSQISEDGQAIIDSWFAFNPDNEE